MAYDSTKETQEHIANVRYFLSRMMFELLCRSEDHDASKLQSPEKELFDKFTPLLRDTTYGSDEYKRYLKEMGAALQHHYEVNSHHPEHYANGIYGMSLLDVMEMLADWKAAGMRHADGDIRESLSINRGRFDIDDQLFSILENTVKELGW